MRVKRAKSSERDLAEVVQEKTAKLIAAKQKFNSLVADVEKELTEAIAEWDLDRAHISLQTAKDCIQAIKYNRSLLPQLISDLKEGLEFTQGEVDPEGSDNETVSTYQRPTPIPRADEEEDASLDSGAVLSGDEAPPNLEGISFDRAGYLRQYDHNEDLELDEFRDLDSD
jgi:hypothetical protein